MNRETVQGTDDMTARGRRSRGGDSGARRHRGQHRAGHPARPGRAADDPAGARHPARAARKRDRGIPAPVPGAGLERRAGLAGAGPPRGDRRDRRAVRTHSGRADRPFHGRAGGVPGGRAPGGVGRRRAGAVAAPDRAGGPAGGPPGPARARDRRPHHQPRGDLGVRRARPPGHPDGHDRGARRRAHHAAPRPRSGIAWRSSSAACRWGCRAAGRRRGGLPRCGRGTAPRVSDGEARTGGLLSGSPHQAFAATAPAP